MLQETNTPALAESRFARTLRTFLSCFFVGYFFYMFITFLMAYHDVVPMLGVH